MKHYFAIFILLIYIIVLFSGCIHDNSLSKTESSIDIQKKHNMDFNRDDFNKENVEKPKPNFEDRPKRDFNSRTPLDINDFNRNRMLDPKVY